MLQNEIVAIPYLVMPQHIDKKYNLLYQIHIHTVHT